jgi:tyrosine-protein phosphatase YwqE
MFSFFRKKNNNLPADFSALSADMHSHLIPGIDDGAPDMDASLNLIRGLIDLGYKKIITTPHIYSDLYPNTPGTIGAGYKDVMAELERQKITVEFHAAAEYLMDEQFSRMLDDTRPLLTLKDKWVLVELSFVVPAINLKEILFGLQMKGYQPILAHPERYLYFGANKAWYDQLRDAGCLFQLNLLSFAGYYGKGPQELAEFLIKKKYVDLLGTDLHHERHLHALRTSQQIFGVMHKLLDSGLIRNPTL